ncbi:type IX secretion system protein PorG [Joostella sp. CR20]|uniref:type IX secretion system protein PorG n=1 Tax=Joostella sp. CR20 TaxID=2804312 RepID=UPI00313DC201
MNFRILAIVLMLTTTISSAQMFEAGVFVGGSNYIGDVGSSWYIKPNGFAAGGLFKWNISKRYAYRASVTLSTLHGADRDSDNAARQSRDYSFSNDILEGSIGMEFNFLEFDLDDFSRPITPYIYGGVSVFLHDDLYYIGNNAQVFGNKTTFAIPMTLGVKGKISTRFILAAEVGARYTFTDNIDGSNPEGGTPGTSFGNIFSDDWYVFSGVTLTYTFGERPCYSCFD